MYASSAGAYDGLSDRKTRREQRVSLRWFAPKKEDGRRVFASEVEVVLGFDQADAVVAGR
jgi:hypothetical protein